MIRDFIFDFRAKLKRRNISPIKHLDLDPDSPAAREQRRQARPLFRSLYSELVSCSSSQLSAPSWGPFGVAKRGGVQFLRRRGATIGFRFRFSPFRFLSLGPTQGSWPPHVSCVETCTQFAFHRSHPPRHAPGPRPRQRAVPRC